VACYAPLKAYKGPGGIKFNSREGYSDMPLRLKCGQCRGCRLDRKRAWAIRCVHESQMHEKNSFLTLTYDDEHLPEDRGLDVSHWQNFAKKLRRQMGPFRFMHCGEYGEKGLRPHYHALIFGLDFAEDSAPIRRGNDKHALRVSADLLDIWDKGFHTVGKVSFDSAAYVASYTMKKVTGKAQETAYERVDPETGECWSVRPEYATMSRNPGLGATWFDEFAGDVYPGNFVVMKGQKFQPPSFYDNRLKGSNPEMWKKMMDSRKKNVRSNEWNMSDERLEIREQVAFAKEHNRGEF